MTNHFARLMAAGVLFAAATGLSGTALAGEFPRADALERSLQGTWTGALQYRDYQSNKLFGLDVTTQIAVGPDKVTITRLSAFDDGPKTGFVYITSVSLFDADGSHVTTATFRKGRAVEVSTDEARVTAYTDDRHWTIVYHVRDMDDDKPADIRVTQTRNGDDLLAVKDVKPAGAPDTAYQFRNQTRLTVKP